MEDAGQKLTPKQDKALASLLALGEVRAAAKDAGVGETTLWRWLKDETFATAYRAQRCKLLEAGAASLTSNVAKASKVLIGIAESEDAPASARVAAARAIIEGAHKTVETLDLLPRVAELEKFLADKKGGKNGR
jgi:hypothetical protein